MLNHSSKLKEKIKSLEAKNRQYKNAAIYLVTYNKYLSIYEELNKKAAVLKKSSERKHEREIRTFNHEALQSPKMNINPNLGADKAIALIKDQDTEINNLKKGCVVFKPF